MDMIEVKSSVLKSIGYDAEAQKVHVEYQNGSTFAFVAVPADVYEKFKNSESVGKFMNAELKGKYVSERVGAGGLAKANIDRTAAGHR
jgi:non-canonical (house-cleaning) NTP pyrophosphatase